MYATMHSTLLLCQLTLGHLTHPRTHLNCLHKGGQLQGMTSNTADSAVGRRENTLSTAEHLDWLAGCCCLLPSMAASYQLACPRTMSIASINVGASTSTVASFVSRSTCTPLTWSMACNNSTHCTWVDATWANRGLGTHDTGRHRTATYAHTLTLRAASTRELHPPHFIPSTITSSSTVFA